MRNMRYIYLSVLLVEILFLSTGCTRRSLLEEMHPHTTEGLLKINLECLGSSKPRSMGFYFYCCEGKEPFYREGTIQGFEGYIPAGTYDVVICNPDVIGVGVKNYQGYKADQVEANIHTEDASCIEHVDNIYGTGLEHVVIPPDAVVEKTAIPQNLVKKLTILLRARTRKKVEEMQVNLSGAVMRKRIVDLHISEETSDIKSYAVYDSAENAFRTSISTLGFKGKCPINVHLTYEDKARATCIPIDLTPVLLVFPEEEKTLEYTLLLPDGEEIQMSVQLHQWVSGGGGEIKVE